MLTTYQFRGCRVLADDLALTVETTFPNGAMLRAMMDETNRHAERAASLGYDSTSVGYVWRYLLDRELFHTVAAEFWGLDYSPTLWVFACRRSGIKLTDYSGPSPMQIEIERKLIADLQAYFRGSGKFTDDIKHLADAAGVRPGLLRSRFASHIEDAKRMARAQG